MDQTQENDVVYHCIPVTPTGDAIRPGTGYGAKIPESILQQFNAAADVKIPLIFAAMKQSKAVAYGFQFATGEALRVMSIEIDGEEQELAFVSNRKETMSRPRDATIYEVSRQDFLDLRADQCVSKTPIPFNEAKVAYRIKNAEDIMRGGVQVLSFGEGYDELMRKGTWQEFLNLFSKPDFAKELGKWVVEGKLVWENNAHQVNAPPGFAKMLGIDPQQSPKKSLTPSLK